MHAVTVRQYGGTPAVAEDPYAVAGSLAILITLRAAGTNPTRAASRTRALETFRERPERRAVTAGTAVRVAFVRNDDFVRPQATEMTSTSADQSARPLPPGTQAPDLEFPASPDASVSLAELRRQPVILALVPTDWRPVCSDQMAGVVDAIGGELSGSVVGRNQS